MQGFDLSTATNITLGATGVNSVYLGSTLIWPRHYELEYLTIISIADNNTIGFKTDNGIVAESWQIYISTDNGSTWTSKLSSVAGTILATLNTGDKLLIKGTHTSYSDPDPNNDGAYLNYAKFTTTDSIRIEGNIMSLVYGDQFINQVILNGTGNFYKLFAYCNVVNAHNLFLAPMTLTRRCYESLFLHNTDLVTYPKLDATNLAEYCYRDMFDQCTSLIGAPSLPAQTLAIGCYESMFNNCTSLSSTPTLRATTLVDSCYANMFNDCQNLGAVLCLATDISATNCTYDWLDGVNATGTFYKNANMSNWSSGSSGIPSGWTVQDYQ